MKRLALWASCLLVCLLLLAGCDTAGSSTKAPPLLGVPTGAEKAPIGTILLTYKGERDGVNALAWSPDSTRIASGGGDGVQIWDAATGNLLLDPGQQSLGTLTPVSSITALAWSPDGQRLVIAGEIDYGTITGRTAKVTSAGIVVVDATTGKSVVRFDGVYQIGAVAWSPDGTRIAGSGSNENTMFVWNATTGKTLQTYKGHTGTVTSLAWSPDGTSIASASQDRTVQIWNATTGKTLPTYQGHSQIVETVAWSPDGKHLASGGIDTTVQVWDATTGTTVFTYKGHVSVVHALAWSPDGKRMVSSSGGASGGATDDEPIQVWDAFTGDHAYSFPESFADATPAVLAWSPDGTRIASGIVRSRHGETLVQVWLAG